MELADPEFLRPGPIDAIFDVEVYSNMLKEGVITGTMKRLLAQNPELGWLLSGNFPVFSGQQSQLKSMRAKAFLIVEMRSCFTL